MDKYLSPPKLPVLLSWEGSFAQVASPGRDWGWIQQQKLGTLRPPETFSRSLSLLAFYLLDKTQSQKSGRSRHVRANSRKSNEYVGTCVSSWRASSPASPTSPLPLPTVLLVFGCHFLHKQELLFVKGLLCLLFLLMTEMKYNTYERPERK